MALNPMDLALAEGQRTAARGEVPVGAVIVRDGAVIAVAGNRTLECRDPTAHAEMLAIRAACETLGSERLPDCDLYVTLEPCTMCAGAAVNGRVGRLVFGARDLKAGGVVSLYGIGSDPRLNHEFAVTADVCADECGELLTTFFSDRR